MRRFWIGAFLLVLAAGGVFVVTRARTPDAIFEGKPLSQWLDGGFEDASRALNQVEPGVAVDCIFAKLKREHPKYSWRARYRRLWEKVPDFSKNFLPRPRMAGFDDWRAFNTLLVIGPRAIPILDHRLEDKSFLVRGVSAQTLGYFRQRGSRIRATNSSPQKSLQDPAPTVPGQATAAHRRALAECQAN